MKKHLLCVGVVLAGLTVNAQTYFFDDFSSGTLGNWNITDSDGDGNNWSVADYNDGVQEEHASSASWTSTAGALTPNNWMISDPIDLSTATGTVLLEWLVYAQDQAWADEYYSVYVATANDIPTLTASSTTFSEVVGTSSGYESRVLDVSTFAGQTIYVAFRHHNCTDEFRLNIDDIEVRTPLANDAEMVSLDIDPIIVAGNYSIQGTIYNNGSNPITSYDITWDAGSGVQTQAFTNTIASGATYNFTHSTPLVAVAGTTYNIDVCVVLTGDGDAANNCLSASTSVATQEGTRLPLMEEFTSSTCVPCYNLNTTGFGGGGLNAYLSGANANVSGTADLAVVKYQVNWPGSGDHAYNGDVSTRVTYYNITGAPTVLVDGLEGVSNPSGVTAAAAVPTYLDLSATHSTSGNVLTVNVNVDPYASWTGARVFVALLDKSYAAGTDASFSNGEDEFHHVLRKLIPNANGLSANLVGGTPFTTTQNYTFSYHASYPAQGSFQLHAISEQEVVVFVQDANGNILNSAISVGSFSPIDDTSVGEGASLVKDLSVYPNPTSEMTNIAFSVADGSNVSVEITNTLGQVVFSQDLGEVSGQQKLEVNAADYEAGLYLINITVDGYVRTERISVVK